MSLTDVTFISSISISSAARVQRHAFTMARSCAVECRSMLLPLLAIILLARPSHCFGSDAPSKVEALLSRAQSLVEDRDTEAAFATLSEIYAVDPNARGLTGLFESCLQLKVQDSGSLQDRFGLAALLLDQERYEEASVQLRHILCSEDNDCGQDMLEKASSMLFRSNAACCHWDSYIQDSEKLVASLRLSSRVAGSDPNEVPVVHPFEALKWPCITLPQATQIASLYARRSIFSTNDKATADGKVELKRDVPLVSVSRESDRRTTKQTDSRRIH